MKLKELRIQKGVTQQEVANAIGCSASNYARYERGERWLDRETLISLSDYFNVSSDVVIGRF